ncbi:MAG: hypothetical protein HY650_02555 [Acidobacteria bacterium]|nr:hypothetical protein [Acidobacteriota bacterium]
MFGSLLERIAAAFANAEIPYMVIGGQAVLLYGEPRLTKDVDITLGVGLDRLDEVVGVAASLAFQPLVDPETFTRRTCVLPCLDVLSGIRCDLIFSFSSFEQAAMLRTRAVRIGETDVRFVSLEDLIIHKMVAGRPRDLEDVKSLMLKNPRADNGYVKHWLDLFSASLGEPFRQRFDELLKELTC